MATGTEGRRNSWRYPPQMGRHTALRHSRCRRERAQAIPHQGVIVDALWAIGVKETAEVDRALAVMRRCPTGTGNRCLLTGAGIDAKVGNRPSASTEKDTP